MGLSHAVIVRVSIRSRWGSIWTANNTADIDEQAAATSNTSNPLSSLGWPSVGPVMPSAPTLTRADERHLNGKRRSASTCRPHPPQKGPINVNTVPFRSGPWSTGVNRVPTPCFNAERGPGRSTAWPRSHHQFGKSGPQKRASCSPSLFRRPFSSAGSAHLKWPATRPIDGNPQGKMAILHAIFFVAPSSALEVVSTSGSWTLSAARAQAAPTGQGRVAMLATTLMKPQCRRVLPRSGQSVWVLVPIAENGFVPRGRASGCPDGQPMAASRASQIRILVPERPQHGCMNAPRYARLCLDLPSLLGNPCRKARSCGPWRAQMADSLTLHTP